MPCSLRKAVALHGLWKGSTVQKQNGMRSANLLETTGSLGRASSGGKLTLVAFFKSPCSYVLESEQERCMEASKKASKGI